MSTSSSPRLTIRTRRGYYRITYLMLHNVSIVNAAKQIAGEGIIHLYRGVLPPLCQKSVSVSLMFGVYDKCKKPLLQANYNPILSTILAAHYCPEA
ncbi:hypothetical protein GE061_007629 [Apolygus lucorum]|uniref:Uncharacterized protein n=1 Tax=Apolygus lucorum TaxID=248454 RepID=A0A8S9WSH7_APOLU|nr:hypothetical protein GE061_007629 [Apolygus lucorum]